MLCVIIGVVSRNIFTLTHDIGDNACMQMLWIFSPDIRLNVKIKLKCITAFSTKTFHTNLVVPLYMYVCSLDSFSTMAN